MPATSGTRKPIPTYFQGYTDPGLPARDGNITSTALKPGINLPRYEPKYTVNKFRYEDEYEGNGSMRPTRGLGSVSARGSSGAEGRERSAMYYTDELSVNNDRVRTLTSDQLSDTSAESRDGYKANDSGGCVCCASPQSCCRGCSGREKGCCFLCCVSGQPVSHRSNEMRCLSLRVIITFVLLLLGLAVGLGIGLGIKLNNNQSSGDHASVQFSTMFKLNGPVYIPPYENLSDPLTMNLSAVLCNALEMVMANATQLTEDNVTMSACEPQSYSNGSIWCIYHIKFNTGTQDINSDNFTSGIRNLVEHYLQTDFDDSQGYFLMSVPSLISVSDLNVTYITPSPLELLTTETTQPSTTEPSTTEPSSPLPNTSYSSLDNVTTDKIMTSQTSAPKATTVANQTTVSGDATIPNQHTTSDKGISSPATVLHETTSQHQTTAPSETTNSQTTT